MKYYKTTTKYNCGIDLHTRQMYICVMDRGGNILVHRNIRNNDFGFFLKLVEPYKDDLTVTCESCFDHPLHSICSIRCAIPSIHPLSRRC